MPQQGDHGGTADKRNEPAPTRADRAFRSTAHQPKSRVERSDGLSARDPPRPAAPNQKAAERDDEGRHAQIGDDVALQRADKDAERQPGRERYDPGEGAFEAEKL